jgi:outer membrane receptor protein involved in Fe transport
MIMGRTSRKLALAGSVAAIALSSGGAALAQSNVTELDVVVVTAQKRTENVQDVPISISVVTGEDLQQRGASQISDYAAFIPGLQIDNQGSPGKNIISLRGITPLAAGGVVGLYLDDAPIGSSGLYNRTNAFSLDMMPYDIQRFELLRGPQGTLYGAAAIGGLLKYVTIDPSVSQFSGKAGAELFGIDHGKDTGYAVGGLVNIPLVQDVLGMTASYSRRNTPGYIDNIQTGERDINDVEQQGARLSLLYKPTDKFSARLQAVWQDVGADNNATVIETAPGVRIGDGYDTNLIRREPFDTTFKFYSASFNYDLDFATLSSTTSYSDADIFERIDASRVYGVLVGGNSDFDSSLTTKKWTQEVRLASPSSDRFEWLLGGFYTDEKNTHEQTVYVLDSTTGALLPGLNPLAVIGLPNTYKEWSIFGNATYKFSKRFQVTGGLRYARNDQTFRQISAGVVVPPADQPGSSNEDVLTYSFSPQFHIDDDTMLYARIASGYRPGGPNLALPGIPSSVASDTLTNYEAGVKSSLLGGALRIDAALFYMDWKDVQLSVQFPGGFAGLANAAAATSQGFEASVEWRPTRGLVLGANGAYTDAHLTEDTPASVGGKDGDPLPRIPKFSGSLTADYDWVVNGDVTARVGAAVRYTGDRWSDLRSGPTAIKIDSYTALDLNAAITFKDKWTLRAYARNVTNTDADIYGMVSLTQPGAIQATPLQPRTIGVGIDVNF